MSKLTSSPSDPHAALCAAITQAAIVLPTQPPIGAFVTYNLLEPYEHMPFHDALALASERLDCSVYLSVPEFQTHYQRGRIDDDDLQFAFEILRPQTVSSTDPIAPRLSLHVLERLALLRDIQPTTSEHMRWEIYERALLRRYLSSTPAHQRSQITQSTLPWAKAHLDALIQGDTTLSDLISTLFDPSFSATVAASLPPSPAQPPALAPALSSLLPNGDAQKRYLTSLDAALQAHNLALSDASRALWLHTERSLASSLLLSALALSDPSPASLLRHFEQHPDSWAVALLWRACSRLARSTPPLAIHRFSPDWIANIGSSVSHRDALHDLSHKDPAELSNEPIIRFCAAFLDEGMATWSMPHRAQGMLHAWQSFTLATATAPRVAWQRGLVQAVRASVDQGLTSLDIITNALRDLGVPESAYAAYLQRVLLQLPGWAGMVYRLETSPTDRSPTSPPTSLHDFLAIRLTYDLLAIRHCATESIPHALFSPSSPLSLLSAALRRIAEAQDFTTSACDDHDRPWRLFLLCQHAGFSAYDLSHWTPDHATATIQALDDFTHQRRLQVWQEAFEHHYRREFVAAVISAPHTSPKTPEFQLAFCIDDREEAFRRHLEEVCPEAETFGIAGFFGVAIDYQGLDDGSLAALCPVIVAPSHAIYEIPTDERNAALANDRKKRRRVLVRAGRIFNRLSRSMILGALLSPLAGLLAAFPLFARVVTPRALSQAQRAMRLRFLPSPKTHLLRTHVGDHIQTPHGHNRQLGFTVEEQAARIKGALELMGMTKTFAPIIVFMGHGSSSVNNPHMAVYDCGACSSKHGGPNARLFADMANSPDVRALLRESNILIPDSTWFIGGMHDTCTEDVTLYDLDAVPAALLPSLAKLQRALDEARARTAHERCRRFASAPKHASPAKALRHVQGRAVDLSQARPEYGHAGVASCIVGHRDLSHNVFLDHRAFLVSYDVSSDPNGAVLERLMSAVGPVCSGINLCYYFSRTDPLKLGSGSKLPHNMTALLGVMNGSLSDLRPGLPYQGVEIHEPLRLQLIIEAEPQTILDLSDRLPSLLRLAGNGWIQVIALSPSTSAAHFFIPGQGFVPWRWHAPKPIAHAPNSIAWYEGRDVSLPPAIISASSSLSQAA
jgi:uncharacterized protein